MPEIGDLHHEAEGIRFAGRQGYVPGRPEWGGFFAGGGGNAVLGLEDTVDIEFERAIGIRNLKPDPGALVRKYNSQGVSGVAFCGYFMSIHGKLFPEHGIGNVSGRRGGKAVGGQKPPPVKAPFAVK